MIGFFKSVREDIGAVFESDPAARSYFEGRRQSKDTVDETWLLWLDLSNSRKSLSPVHSSHHLAPRRPVFMRPLIVDD